MDGKSYSGQIAQVSTISGPQSATLMEPICTICLWKVKIKELLFLIAMFGQERAFLSVCHLAERE